MANTYLARLNSDDPDQNGRVVEVSSETATVGTHLALTKDLSTHPNTEDSAVVEQPGLEIEGPAWVRGDLIIEDLVVPVGADRVAVVVRLLDEDWTSGESDAEQLVSGTRSDSSPTTGGLITGQVGASRLFVKSGTTAKIGLTVQPIDESDVPVAGQATGTARAIIYIERTA